MIKWVTFIMCINYRIHHEHNMALQSAAGCPLNPDFLPPTPTNFRRNSTVISLTMCWRFPRKPVFVKASMNAAIGSPMSAVCKRASQQSRLSDRPRPVAGLPKSIAARGVDQRRWQRFGCATRPIPNLPEVKASRKCSASAPDFRLTSRQRLRK